MASHSLSKSTYIRGLQCHKSLYLHKFRPYLRDKLSDEQLAKFARGHAIGKVAQQLFPGGIALPRPSNPSAQKTAKLIEEGFPVIYEACFIADEVIIALDILVKSDNGWGAYEVKSSLALSQVYYQDAFLQYHVMKASGLKPEQFSLVHRNGEMDINETLDLNERFVFTDVTSLSEEAEPKVAENIEQMKELLKQDRSPDIEPGPHCMYPYPCDFKGVCWKRLTLEEQEILNNNKHQQE